MYLKLLKCKNLKANKNVTETGFVNLANLVNGNLFNQSYICTAPYSLLKGDRFNMFYSISYKHVFTEWLELQDLSLLSEK